MFCIKGNEPKQAWHKVSYQTLTSTRVRKEERKGELFKRAPQVFKNMTLKEKEKHKQHQKNHTETDQNTKSTQ